ncbi:hypothetical protein KKA15_06725 [Patescibacteria group bacterium]|nr:hypothetical protein [Patescibacteria group bacterium]
MSIEEQFNQEVKKVLERIKYLDLATPKDQQIEFKVEPDKHITPLMSGRTEQILHKLEEWKVITIESIYNPPGDMYMRKFFNIKVIQPEFDKLFGDYKLGKGVIDKKIVSGDHKIELRVENNKGILYFNHNSGIDVGGKNTRRFKLLQCLLVPKVGLARKIDQVFEAIRIDKDQNNKSLNDPYLKAKEKMKIIEDTRREIYRAIAKSKMRGSIKIHIAGDQAWIELC